MKKKKIYIGIDPGVNGAVVFMTNAGTIFNIVDLPTNLWGSGKKKKKKIDAKALREVLKGYKIKCVFVENVAARPGQGVVSMFNFGLTFGIIQGLLIGMKVKTIRVTPQAWKRYFDLINADKDDARLTAINLFPEWVDSFKFKKNVDRADAALICRYGIENLTGEKV